MNNLASSPHPLRGNPVVKFVMGDALMHSWEKVSDWTISFLQACFHGIGQTKVVEDGNKAIRTQAQQDPSHRLSARQKWLCLIRSIVANQLHNFPMLDPLVSDLEKHLNKDTALPPGIHKLIRQEASAPDLLKIESTKDSTWPSFTAQSYTRLFGEQVCFNQMANATDITLAFQGAFLGRGNLVRNVPVGPWKFVLGLHWGHTCTCFPVELTWHDLRATVT